MGLSQQRLADLMGIKRGKIAGYFYETQAKPNFYEQLGEVLDVDMGKFLTVTMTDENYSSFFSKSDTSEIPSGFAEGTGDYNKKSTVFDLLLKAKSATDPQIRSQLLDTIIRLYGKVLDENSELKDENGRLKDELLELSRRLLKKE